MKNKLLNLNDHLFVEIERLGDGCLKGEELTREIDRAKAVSNIAVAIIANGRLLLDAAKAAEELPGIKKQLLLLE
jgi:hypothetical protein